MYHVFRMRHILGMASGIALLATASTAGAQDVWRLQSSSVAGDSIFEITAPWYAKTAAMTGGKVQLELLPIGSVVPHNQTMDAIAQGILQGDVTSTAYFAGRDKAFAIMGDLVAGYDTPWQIMQFCYHGGGREFMQKMFDQFTNGQVVVVGCASVPRESFTSKVPIRTVADLQGLKIRAPEGMTAELFQRAGASTVAMPPSETYTSLDKGVVDAADNSNYTMDKSMGMHEIAGFPIFPGIHSMPTLQFTVNRSKWESLDEGTRDVIDSWYRAMITYYNMETELRDLELVAADRANPESGIEVINWNQEERDRLREIAVGVWEDFAADSDLAKEAYDLNITFMRNIGLLN